MGGGVVTLYYSVPVWTTDEIILDSSFTVSCCCTREVAVRVESFLPHIAVYLAGHH